MGHEANRLRVRRLTEAQYQGWSRLVVGAPAATLYALPDYLDILSEAISGHFHILGVFDDEKLLGGNPMLAIPEGGRTPYRRPTPAGDQRAGVEQTGGEPWRRAGDFGEVPADNRLLIEKAQGKMSTKKCG